MTRLLIDGNNVLMSLKFNPMAGGDVIIFSFFNTLFKIIDEVKPSEVIIAWDKGASWRKNLSPDYKGNRIIKNPTETQVKWGEGLNRNRTWLKENLPFFGINQMWFENGEADDIAGWFAIAYRDKPTVLYSKDQDWLMLVDDNTRVMFKDPKKGAYMMVDLDNFELMSTWKTPEEFLLAKCAIGDKGDNIKGLHKVGQMTMRKYLSGTAPAAATARLDEFFSGSELLKLNLKLMDIRASVITRPIHMVKSKFNEEKALALLAELKLVNLYNRQNKWLPNLRNLSADVSYTT